MSATLEVRNLRTHFFTRAGVVKAVDDVSFSVGRGEVLGLVGESGSGKSVTGFSIIGLIDPPGRLAGGQILYKGQDLATLSERDMRHLRGNRIAMIFQDPMMTLNPVLRIDTQMIETVLAHDSVSRDEARRLRDACRQTNKGISRLRRRCDSQTKKIAALKAALVEAFGAHAARGGEIKQSWIEAVEGRRPEKAT